MKKIVLFFLLLIMTTISFSQQTNPSQPLTKEDYLKKGKAKKSGAWLLLGGGFGVLAITAITNAGVDFQNKKSFPVVSVSIGGAMMIGSIPLFIAAKKNKRKAMSMSFKNQLSPQLQNSGFVYRSVPSLNLKFSL
jgi:hypothetical protein